MRHTSQYFWPSCRGSERHKRNSLVWLQVLYGDQHALLVEAGGGVLLWNLFTLLGLVVAWFLWQPEWRDNDTCTVQDDSLTISHLSCITHPFISFLEILCGEIFRRTLGEEASFWFINTFGKRSSEDSRRLFKTDLTLIAFVRLLLAAIRRVCLSVFSWFVTFDIIEAPGNRKQEAAWRPLTMLRWLLFFFFWSFTWVCLSNSTQMEQRPSAALNGDGRTKHPGERVHGVVFPSQP